MNSIAELAKEVCNRLHADGTPTSEFAAALVLEDKAYRRRSIFMATHAECLSIGLADHSLTLTRVGLFGVVADLHPGDLNAEAVERRYYAALADYGAPSLLSKRLNTEN